MSQRVAILCGVRTPFCKAGGRFANIQADDLGAVVTKDLLARTGIEPSTIDQVVFGNVAQPAHAANIARVIALKSGFPHSISCHTVHRNCASGMESITSAATQILAGRADLILAGGTESMSNIPLLLGVKMTRLLGKLVKAKTLQQKLGLLASVRPSFFKPVIALKLGLTDPVCGLNMGQTAEVLARQFGVTRHQQDAFALISHQRAAEAIKQGVLAQEQVPVVVPPDYAIVQQEDDGPRASQSLAALEKLRPFFDRQAGTVTVGNACPVTDGAAAVLVASEKKANELGIEPLGYLTDWAYAGLDGSRMGLGPAYATAKVLDQTGLSLDDFDLVELNEAFAAQVIANEEAFASADFARAHLGRDQPIGRLDRQRLNVNGGAIALGHPVGATGTRLVITLLKQLARANRRRGLATLCVGGGQGAALVLEVEP